MYASTTIFSRRYSLRRSTIITDDNCKSPSVADDNSSDARQKSVDQINELRNSPDHLVQPAETGQSFRKYYKITAV